MKKRLIELVHGILFGMSCMVPGFSGGTMLLILGIYEQFTGLVAELSTKPFKALKGLWVYIIGAIFGLGLAAITVVACLNRFPIIMCGFFVGLVLATIPMIIATIRKNQVKVGSIISLVVSLVISIILAFSEELGLGIDKSFDKASVPSMLYLLLISTLGSATMIIPAASGMTILIVFGVYYPLMDTLKTVITGIGTLNFQIISSRIWFLLPFVVGIFVGTIGISKVISGLLKKHASIVWYAILSLLVISPITIFKDAYEKRVLPFPELLASINNSWPLQITLSIVCGIIGFLLLFSFYRKQIKKEAEQPE